VRVQRRVWRESFPKKKGVLGKKSLGLLTRVLGPTDRKQAQKAFKT